VLAEKLIHARDADIPWADKTGVQRFFTVFAPIIYIAWGLLLAFGTVCAAIIACAFEQNPPGRRR
jgi:hypothetical protein